ncbi:hypothetical protein GQ43DRAFT_479028 [Delitschia confertaspora ATCC 74209]|uniref:Uncharacterized protein n=1 Tax=Delitschia confertaspora ATCC 74209 TaxID=1513339 RepID=A0A9P4JQE6_9PLEO|nr:hypothetical protein GQ43DRAFT_479028 [Delitschia confertaspora ATCC 74209]
MLLSSTTRGSASGPITRALIKRYLGDIDEKDNESSFDDRITRNSTLDIHSHGTPNSSSFQSTTHDEYEPDDHTTGHSIYGSGLSEWPDDGRVLSFRKMAENLERLAQEELQRAEWTLEYTFEDSTEDSNLSEVPIFLDVDTDRPAGEVGLAFMKPPRFELASTANVVPVDEGQSQQRPESYSELLQVLQRWNGEVTMEHPPPENLYEDPGIWENVVIAAMQQARKEAPKHYEQDKLKLKDHITAAMKAENWAEVERLQKEKVKLNRRRWFEMRRKVLEGFKENYRKEKDMTLQEMQELTVHHASLQWILMLHVGLNLPDLLKVCEQAEDILRQALQKVASEADEQVADIDAVAEMAALLDNSYPSEEELETLGLPYELMESIKEGVEGIHLRLNMLGHSLDRIREGALKRCEAYDKAYAVVDGNPESKKSV